MKKFLLGTTALISAATIASAAQAAGPDVTVGGFIDFQASSADADTGFKTTAGNRSLDRDTHFQNDTEVHILVDGKADNGLGYGAVIELEADVDGGTLEDGSIDSSGRGDGNADKTYIYLESSAGRIEGGNNVGAGNALSVGAENIARATGGIKGDFHRYVDVGQDDSGGFTTPTLLFVPALPTEVDMTAGAAGLLDQEEANKLTYFTPRISGFQAGASYTIDTGDIGSAALLSGEANTDQYENVWNIGANYEGDFDGIGVRVGVTGEFGDAETTATQDIAGWQAGAEVSFEGFSIAGSYGNNDDSRQVASTTEIDYWTAGAAYETGPFGISVTYLDSNTDHATIDGEFTNLVFGADYSLAPGLTPYVEAAFFDAEGAGTANQKNDGNVILVGTQLNF